MKYSNEQLMLMMAVTSFLGWCTENLWLLARKGYADNRNMVCPFLLGYGLAITGFFLLAGTPQNVGLLLRFEESGTLTQGYTAYYIFSFAAVSVGEILLGSTVEAVFGFHYWDYSSLPMHITRYTSIPTSAGFAAMITFFMGECFEPIMSVLGQIPLSLAKPAATLLVSVMAGDLVYSFRAMFMSRKLNERWRVERGAVREHIHSVLSGR